MFSKFVNKKLPKIFEHGDLVYVLLECFINILWILPKHHSYNHAYNIYCRRQSTKMQ